MRAIIAVARIVSLSIAIMLLFGRIYVASAAELSARFHSAALREAGFAVHTHRRVPPNDGGIALGQAAIAVVAARKFALNN